MDELVKLVTKKAGISEEQAKQAVSAVLGYLKKNLPAPIAGQIDGLLSGGNVTKGAADVGNLVGGLLGKKK
jgi:uncharacterized protein (DUF2267 family)